MSTITKILRTKSLDAIKEELGNLSEKQSRKTLKDYFGALPSVFGDALTYQKPLRNEWE